MAGAGIALVNFNDFVEGTGPAYVTGPKSLVNEGVKHTYYFGRLMRGDKNTKKIIQGGESIRESIVFQDNGSFETHLPGANHDWVNPQRLKKVEAQWRYTMCHMSWVEQEIIHNQAIKYGNEDVRFHQYVDLLYEKETIMWSSKWNGLEDLLWALPVAADMETESGTEPYSIPAFINELTNGLYTGWTTVEGIDPTAADVDSKFAPQQVGYNESNSDHAVNVADNVISKFDLMWHDVMFEQPETQKQYFEDPRLNNQMILCSKAGRRVVMQMLRASQDHFVTGAQDPAYPDPMYYMIPIKRVSTLDTANLYAATAGGFTSEDVADITGPRYYWVNGNYMYPVFEEERYFHKYEVTKHHNVPDTWVCPVATWYNILCTSRQRQGIVYPTVDAPV